MEHGTEITVDSDLLDMTLVQAERMIDIQREELESLYRRTEGLVRLSVAAIAGVIATIGLIATSSIRITCPGFAGFSIGSGALFSSLLLFISVLTGFPRPVRPSYGPRVSTLVERLTKGESSLADQRVSVLLSLSGSSERLGAINETLVKRLSQGIGLFAFSTATLLTTLAFILGGTIHA